MMLRLMIVIALALVVTGCTGQRGPTRAQLERIDKALRTVPPAPTPSEVVARELAFARAASENGYASAARQFGTLDAVIHGRDGPVPFRAVLSGLPDDPALAPQWVPRTVVMSCDGRVAVSSGRFEDAEGFVGRYVTVWQRANRGEEFSWVYDVAGRDDPQPSGLREQQGEEIVVTADESIRGFLADCPRADRPIAPQPSVPVTAGDSGTQTAPDGTLRWRWEHRPDGTKFVAADHWGEGEWQTIIKAELASPRED